jgi:hypothetical protein
MDQELNIQLAALIFLAGTQSLGSSGDDVAVETSTAMNDEGSEETDPVTISMIPNSNIL